MAACFLTVMFFGWAPALQAMNADLRGVVASATAGSTPTIHGRITLRALVIAEFTLASLMFVSGGLLVRAYDRVRNVDPGFDPQGVYTFSVSLPGVTYSDAPAIGLPERFEQRLRVVPGVTNAGLITCAL